MITKEEWLKLKEKAKLLKEAAGILSTEEEHLPKTIRRFLREIKEMEEKLKAK